ncbi:MAG: hypothetical protein N3G22_04240 [Candidatus Micrarchaeota archaeon]|nr:hypothetical protein [Candidatus Micrarchaeota archaeon]
MRYRAFFFTIDATLSLFLLIAAMVVAAYLAIQGEEDLHLQVQTIRAARDVLFFLDREGVLESADDGLIEASLDAALPANMGARMFIETYYYDNGYFYSIDMSEYGDEIPAEKTLYWLRHAFVSVKNKQVTNYSVVRMVVWQK